MQVRVTSKSLYVSQQSIAGSMNANKQCNRDNIRHGENRASKLNSNSLEGTNMGSRTHINKTQEKETSTVTQQWKDTWTSYRLQPD